MKRCKKNMILTNILVDINVCLDIIFNNPQFAASALEIAERSELGEFSAYVAAHGLDTMFYVLRKRAGGTGKAKQGIKDIRKSFSIASVTESVIDNAIEANWNDFEDAIHHQAAVASGCDAIITRNVADFKASTLQVLSPSEFLARLHSGEEE